MEKRDLNLNQWKELKRTQGMRITPLMMTSLGQQLSMERRIKYPNRSIHQIRSAFSPQPDHIRTRQCVSLQGACKATEDIHNQPNSSADYSLNQTSEQTSRPR